MKRLTYKADDAAPIGAPSEIVFYNTIQELPMFRLNEFQIHLTQDAGIGSTLADHDKRLELVYDSLASNDVANAIRELQNAKIGWYVMLQGISTQARCLADLVFSLDGQPVTDFSDENMLKIHSAISLRLTVAQVGELIEDLKKKFKRELETSFPELFTDNEQIAFYALLIRRAKLQLEDWRANSDTPNPEILVIDAQLREEIQAEIFDSNNSKNAVDARRRAFETVCTGLLLHGVPNPELLSVYKFHSRILYIQQNQPKKKHDSLSENV